ncbi:MAG: HDOD domain-containing protein [Gammaproteobacteria bacterium]|nr:HDOD domain-containing protein [Gammaproteobacteria bacterium]
MFGIGRRTDSRLSTRPSSSDLAQLVPYAGADAATIRDLTNGAVLLALKSGKIPPDWFVGHSLFLHSGQLELQSANGERQFLSSVSPPARFPLPAPTKIRIRALGAVTFLQVPNAVASEGSGEPIQRRPADPHLATLSRILENKLASGDIPLPSMPDLAAKLNAAMHNPDSRSDDHDIAKLIQLDPALATKVIHLVNSAAFRFAHRADTVQQAVTRLGRSRIRNLALGFLIRNAFDTRSPALRKHANALWLRSCHVAAVSFTLARQLSLLDPERAMLAGLVHQIGVLPILGLAQQQPQLFGQAALLDIAVPTFEKRLGRFVLEHWKLGDDLVDVVDHAGDWRRIGYAVPDYVDIVLLAQRHADMGRPGIDQGPPIDSLPAFRKLELGRLTPRKSIRVLEEAEREIVELRRILSGNG